MSSGKITVLTVLGLVVAAVVAVWLKVPALEDLENQLWDQALTEARGKFGGAGEAGGAGDALAAIALARTAPTGGEAAPAAAGEGHSVVELFTDDDVEAARAGRRVYYQFSDDQGNVHFVEHFEDVPAAYRDRVGRVEMGGQQPTRATRQVARSQPRQSAPQKPKRRPFAYSPDPEVVVYSAPWCGWCRKTIAHLDGKGVDFQTKDIEADPRYRDELLRKLGSRRTQIPVVEIDGELIRGHDPGRIDALLSRST